MTKDNKELRELEEAIEQANREYTDTFSPIEETKRMYRIYTIEYDKDGNDKGGFTHQNDLLELQKALAQAKKEGREEAIGEIRKLKNPYLGELNPKVMPKEECLRWRFGKLIFNNIKEDILNRLKEKH
jgi:hypothetical protein